MEFTRILLTDKDLVAIDFGGNIGVYSLYAAKAGNKVITIEPFPDNVNRIIKAVQIEKLEDRITLIQNAVTNKRNQKVNLGPQPKGWWAIKDGDPGKIKSASDITVDTILVDDLIDLVPKGHKKGIIKIDIEGHEPVAFLCAKRLFEHLEIKALFMEWDFMKRYNSSFLNLIPIELINNLVTGNLRNPKYSANYNYTVEMLELFKYHDLKPYDPTKKFIKLDWNWLTWPYDVVFKK